MVIDTFFSHWVVRQHGDGFGIPSNYVYTISGHLLDTKAGKNLCRELELTWKYPKQQEVIPAPDLQYILQVVTIQHQYTCSSLVACSVGLCDSPSSPNQDENLGAEPVDRGEPQKFANPFCSKHCKCGQQ